MKYNIELPFFCGFYETIIDPRYMESYEYNDAYGMRNYIEEFGIDFSPEDMEIDYPKFKNDIAKYFVKNFKKYIPGWIISMEFQEVVSPQFYNFETDRIFVDIETSPDYKNIILDFINKHYDEVEEYIKKYHSSRDGYVSFMSNKIEDWINDIKNNDNVDHRIISEILKMQFLFEILPDHYGIYSLKDYNEYEIAEELFLDGILENTYIGEYLYHDKKDYIDRKRTTRENKELLKENNLTVSSC